jgi:hypothetical protein
VIVVSIVGQVLKNKLQFRELNLVPKLDDRLNKLIGVIEHTTCKRCLDMAEKPEVGGSQARTIWGMRNGNERISTEKGFGSFEE